MNIKDAENNNIISNPMGSANFTVTMKNLKPCPFCGGGASEYCNDGAIYRGVKITTSKCDSAISNKEELDRLLVAFEVRCSVPDSIVVSQLLYDAIFRYSKIQTS